MLEVNSKDFVLVSQLYSLGGGVVKYLPKVTEILDAWELLAHELIEYEETGGNFHQAISALLAFELLCNEWRSGGSDLSM